MDSYEVVLEFQLDQTVDGNVLVNAMQGKARLQHLEIVDVFVFLVGVEFDLVHLHVAYTVNSMQRQDHITVDGVHQLAYDGARADTLNFGHIQLQQVIDPGEQITATLISSCSCSHAQCAIPVREGDFLSRLQQAD